MSRRRKGGSGKAPRRSGSGSSAVFRVAVSVRVKPLGVGAGEPYGGRTAAARGGGRHASSHADDADADARPGHREIPHLVSPHMWSSGYVTMGPEEGTVTKKVGPFHSVLQSSYDQARVYQETMPDLVDSFLSGYDTTLFAYGQTGSGKTHTLLCPPGAATETALAAAAATAAASSGGGSSGGGPSSSGGGAASADASASALGAGSDGAGAGYGASDNSVSRAGRDSGAASGIPETFGLFPRAMMHVINALGGSLRDGSAQLSASAVEVYMDDVFDLQNKKLRVPVAGMGRSVKASVRTLADSMNVARRDKDGKWVAPWHESRGWVKKDTDYETSGQVDVPITSASDVVKLVRLIEATRSAKSHAMNARSSRSHAVISATLTRRSGGGRESGGGGSLTTSKFMFVDLAGSERIAKSKSEGVAGHEAANINTSLTALGRVIVALGNGGFVPFRDSVLTMLMKSSLGGCARTALVVTVAQEESMADETLCSLLFGQRCAAVKNTVVRRERDPDAEAADIRAMIAETERQLHVMEANGAAGGIDRSFPPRTIDSFLDNVRRMREHEAAVAEGKTAQAELRAAGRTTSKEYKAAADHIRFSASQVQNLKGIVIRQITTGLYKQPMPAYGAKHAQLRQLRTQLERVTGRRESGGGGGGSSAVSAAARGEFDAGLNIKDLLTGFVM